MFDIRRIHDISVIGVHGDLSRDNAQAFDHVLKSLASCELHNVVLNFEDLRHLDYQLVQRIAERIVEFQCDGGDLKMAAASGYIRQILKAMGLDEEVYVSVEEALLSFLGDIPPGDPQ
jgi:anti-anti-sigma factor